jgi:YVTN family beta-propeller protein
MAVTLCGVLPLGCNSSREKASDGANAAQPRARETRVVTLQPPGLTEYASVNLTPGGSSVLPNGRFVTPAGTTLRITHDPFGLAVSPDGKTLLTLHDRVLTVIRPGGAEAPVRLPSYDKTLPSPVPEGSCMGVAFAPGGETAYLSGGNNGSVVLFDLNTLRAAGSIGIDGEFAGRQFTDSFTTDLAVSRDGGRLFVLDRANFRLVTIDVGARKVVQSVPVGRLPFGLALSPDGSLAYVANVGLYEYPLVPGVAKQTGDKNMLPYPPYGIPSKEAEEGVEFMGRKMPGLGSPLVAEAMSVWVVNLASGEVVAKHKPGHQIGQMIEGLEVVGGSSPNSVAVGGRFAYVSNATNDNVAVIDTKTQQVVGHVHIRVDPRLDRRRGLMPFGLALSADEKRLYVALLSLNSVAVIDTETRKTLGHIPTGWCPTRVRLSADGRTLYVVTARGLGAGPNGGADFKPPAQGTFVGDIQLGSFHAIDVPDDAQLARYTRQVLDNTIREVPVTEDGKSPLPAAVGLRKSPIRHVVYITKENRTYDEVFGQYTKGRGDPTLARFGIGVDVNPKYGGDVIKNVNLMPNHQKMARQWAISDNFYCDSDASVHGHRWMIGNVPNEWVESNHATHKDFRPYSPAPGRRFPDASGAYDPEDYNEIGGLWEQLHRNRVSFRNFGQSNEFAGVLEEWNHTDTGLRMPVIFPMAKAVYDHTCWTYPGYNMSVPDQFRIDCFEEELRSRWLSGKEPFPQFIAMIIPNDHGAEPRPKAGFPYYESFMADNDLALGRVMHTLSRTPWWKDMLVIVIEDDPQGGVDSVDGHRSLLMMAGPYVKRGYVSHTHANFGSVLRAVYQILDLPPVNQFDMAASLLQDFFTHEPDPKPYDIEPVDKRLFDPQKAMDVYDRKFDWRKIKEGPKLDDEGEQREEHYRKPGTQ